MMTIDLFSKRRMNMNEDILKGKNYWGFEHGVKEWPDGREQKIESSLILALRMN
jgi:hypothetical protein